MTVNEQTIKNIVRKVIKSQDYRTEVVNLLNMHFLQFAIEFFKKIVEAKLNSRDITMEWYKEVFMDETLSSDEILINSGLNKKTVRNMYGSERREVVLEASNESFDSLYENVQSLVSDESDIDLTLTIKFKNVSVDLNVSESLIVINVLAVKRAAIRGGLWSTTGKRAEKYLMLTLCELYGVDKSNYNAERFVKDKNKAVDREIDFYLKNNGRDYKCEVKLMGYGNPESADAIIARNSDVFVADTLSQQNKNQCDELGIAWVACRDKDGFKRFKKVLEKFNIPHTDYNNSNIDADLEDIFDKIF